MSDLVSLNAQFPIVDAQGRPTEALRRLLTALVKAANEGASAASLEVVNDILAANGIDLTSDHENRITALEPP